MDSEALEPIAIVGFAGNFPFSPSTAEDFWKAICRGDSAWGPVPSQRFNVDGFYHPSSDRLDTVNTKHGYFLTSNPYEFDAQFFRISPAEAAAMDPQHRGLLECTFQALESAGISMKSISASDTSVFVANSGPLEYPMLLNRDQQLQSKYATVGGASTMLANRISYFFDLHGPSLTLNTACSSGLHALHLGCQSVRARESRVSIIGASNLILGPEGAHIALSNGGFLSDDGVARCFDAAASGYARGEGFAVIILKALKDAIADGDQIRSVVRSTAVNASGKSLSVTQPSARAQSDLIRKAYALAGLGLGDTQYFEAHSTGTRVGDPIEAEAIGSAFKESRTNQRPLLVGSVKANIGHLEGASGLVSIIKAIYMQEQGLVPPNINLAQINPSIDVESLGIELPLDLRVWPTEGLRRISINNFGLGGSNAHAILDDAHTCLTRWQQRAAHHTIPSLMSAPGSRLEAGDVCGPSNLSECEQVTKLPSPTGTTLLVLSASDEAGLERQLSSLHSYTVNCQFQNPRSFADIAFTLSEKRNKLQWRSYILADSAEDIEQVLSTRALHRHREAGDIQMHFVFTGQGAQWCTMGRELLRHPRFRASVEEAEHHLYSLDCPWSVEDELLSEDEDRLNQPGLSQPLCTIIQVALVDLLCDWGIRPSKVVGHSSGEIAAAYTCGAFGKQTAWSLAYYRGLAAANPFAQDDVAQSMVAAALTTTAGQEVLGTMGLDSLISIACVNSPGNITFSGELRALEKLATTLEGTGVFVKKLPVTRAYHSRYMERIAAVYRQLIRSIFDERTLEAHESAVQMFSSVSGDQVSCKDLSTVNYWVNNLLRPVQFLKAMSSLIYATESPRSERIFLEVGPHPALKSSVVEILESFGMKDRHIYLPLLRRQSREAHAVGAAGFLWAKGLNVDIAAVNHRVSAKAPSFLVDFPRYQFNHEHVHQHTSRLVESVSYHSRIRNAYLGARDADWNPQRPSWRNVVDMAELPWTNDHGFGDTAVYPAAGFLVMALEGCRQLIGDDSLVSGYRFRHVAWDKALQLKRQERTEARLYMQPRHDSPTFLDIWFDFRVYGISQGDWVDICQGSVRAESYDDRQPWAGRFIDAHRLRVTQSTFQVHHQHFYRNLADMGFEFGPAFSLLRGLRYSKAGHGCATLPLNPPALHEEYLATEPLVVHPTVLDAFLHLPLITTSEGSWKKIPPIMGTHVDEIWLSSSLLDMTGEEMFASAERTLETVKERTWDVTAVNQRTGLPVVLAIGLKGTALQSFSGTEEEQRSEDLLTFSTTWLPDLESNSTGMIQDYLEKRAAKSNPAMIDQLDQRIYRNIERTLRDCSRVSPGRRHLQRYLAWMEQTMAKRSIESDPTSHSEVEIDSGVLGLIDLISAKTSDVLSGALDPLQLLFEDPVIMENFYRTGFAASAESLRTYFEVLAHGNPNLEILEVGAGTGFATKAVIDALSDHVSERQMAVRFSRYVYTDISSAFFEHAKELFCDHEDRMDFRALDITKDCLHQGFEAESFDVILAAAVVHATPSIKTSLQNLQKLLRPGGRLILVEQSGPRHLVSDYIFGLLPGWWLAEEAFRQEGPLLREPEWHKVLQESGFSGVDLAVKDSRDERYYYNAVLVSHKVQSSVNVFHSSITEIRIVHDRGSTLQAEVAAALTKSAMTKTEAYRYTLETLADFDVATLNSTTCVVVLLDLDGDTLNDMTLESFAQLQSIVLVARQILWATKGASILPTNPDRSKVEGFSRALCSERNDLNFSIVAFEESACLQSMTSKLFSILNQIQETGQKRRPEPIYADKDDLLHISRVVPRRDTGLASSSNSPATFDAHSTPAVHLEIKSAGLLDTLTFVEQSPTVSGLAADEIEVEVHYSSLNFKDVLIALGQIPTKHLGFDAAGVVCGAGSESGFEIGDRVCCSATRAIATILRCKARNAVLLPVHLSLETAAALPVVFSTAYYSLCRIAALRAGERVLIHSAAGGVGQCAVQIAQSLRADVFVTAGTPEKRLMLHETYGIPQENIFSSRNAAFARGIMAATRGLGVDVVLNCLVGDLLQSSFDILSPLGRFVEIGKRDILHASKLEMSTFDKNVTFAAVDLSRIWTHNPQIYSKILKEAISLVANNPTAFPGPQPLHIFPATDVSKAFRALQGGKLSGKVLVSFKAKNQLQIEKRRESRPRFGAHATYVISGGFGGIGRSIIYWMIEQGAKHILVLSRSGRAVDPASQQLLLYAETHAVEIVPVKCDISIAEEVANALAHAKSRMPPVKGCFQSTMVVKDALFHNMTFHDFGKPFPSKVAGSWNLHKALPTNVDFFIMLSSLAGCWGAPAQTNYSAANSYQDSLARYRVANGLKAYSLNLGLVLGTGFAAENFEVTSTLERVGYIGVTEQQVLRILGHLSDPNLDLPQAGDAIIGVGVTLHSDFRRVGKDPPGWADRPTFSHLDHIKAKDGTSSGNGLPDNGVAVNLADLVKHATTEAEAMEHLTTALQIKVASALSIPAAEVNVDQPLHRAGVDSLLAVELRTWFIKNVKVDIAVNIILSEKALGEVSGIAITLRRSI